MYSPSLWTVESPSPWPSADEFASGERIVVEGSDRRRGQCETVPKICRSKIGEKTCLAKRPYDISEVSKEKNSSHTVLVTVCPTECTVAAGPAARSEIGPGSRARQANPKSGVST